MKRVAKSPAYCCRTDAILGERWTLLGDFATPDEAETEANGIRADWENEEVSVEIMGPPHPPLPVVPPPVIDTDDIPF